MAMTVTRTARMYTGGQRRVYGTIALDNSYATNGYTFTVPSFELFKLDLLTVNSEGGVVFEVDYTNSKLKCRWADYDAVADGVLAEVTNGTSLTAVTAARWEAWGI